jgi:hypothetical protein
MIVKRLFEQIISCRLYSRHDAEHFESLSSHVDDDGKIQSELALIVGWGDTLSAAAGK